MRRRIAALAGVLALATTLSGCWVQAGYDEGRSYWNDGETTLTTATVGGLAAQWDAPAPVVGPVYGDLLYVRDGLTVSAVGVADGQTRWSVDLVAASGYAADHLSPGPMAVAGGRLRVPFSYVTHGGSVIVDAASGAVVSGGGGPGGGTEVGPPAVVDDELVSGRIILLGASLNLLAAVFWDYRPTFVLSATGSTRPGGSFAVVGDRVAWSLATEATGFGPACPPYPAPAPPEYCAPDWRLDLGAVPTGVAALGTDRAVYTDDSGTVTVVDMATGAVEWTAELGATASRPAVVGSTLFVGAGGELLALPADGCGAPVCGPTWTAPGGSAIAGGDVVYTADGGDVVAYPAAGCGAPTCAPLATLSVAGLDLTPVVVGGGRLFATGGGRVVAFGLPS